MSRGDQHAGDDPLLVKLRQRVRRDGPLRLDQYIEACLADAEHGYWQRAAMLGASGDFITAPEISQVFGELIGLWAAVAWQQLGSPKPLRLIELGPGRGTLLRDAVRAARRVPGFAEATSLHLVEVSPALRQSQRETLADWPGALAWHAALAEVPDGPAILIANEFLDALPIRQLICMGGKWHERVVDLDAAGALMFSIGAEVSHPGDAAAQPGAVLELRDGELQVLADLAARTSPLLALFIDYGPADSRLGDTLQAVQRHAYVDPLADPGAADLTAHVRFAEFAAKARAAGLSADALMTQNEFLGRLGIVERASRLMAANPSQAAAVEAAVQRLMSPTGMGQLFKVLLVRSPALSPPVPFG